MSIQILRPGRRSWASFALKTAALAAGVLTAFAGALPAAAVEESSTRTESFTLPAGSSPVVRVCNVEGDVMATGYDGAEVRMVAHETYRGDSAADVARAREDLALHTEQQGAAVEIAVGSPCDCRHGRDCGDDRHWQGGRHYGAHHDIELRVPRGVRVELGTVNDGDVSLKDHRGDFRLANVNGSVTALGVAGSGSATTVNGDVTVRFTENPSEDSSFRSVNGKLDVTFRPGLAASFEFDTMNGEVFTDLDLDDQTVSRASHNLENGRFKLRKSYRTAGRAGGPEITFDTLNGDIYLRGEPR
jgi:hypothetical protein